MNIIIENKPIYLAVNEQKADLFATAILQRLGGEANYMRIMKLIYFAERFHIRKYMRPIANDDLVAMKKGMVGSYWLNILRGILQSTFFDSDKVSKARIRNGVNINEEEVLSRSEIDAIDFAINNFGKYDENELVNIIHEYPEWLQYKGAIERIGGAYRIELNSLLEDPKDNPTFKANHFHDPFKPLNPEEKEIIREAINDYVLESM